MSYQRLAGCLPQSQAKVAANRFPDLPGATIPRSEWRSVSIRHQVPCILDQDGTNQCCPHAGVLTVMTKRRQQGYKHILLSSASVYRWINAGRDQGAAIGDCLDTIATYGSLPVSVHSMLDWRAKLPADHEQIAAGFRAYEWDKLPDFDAFATAAQGLQPICFGVIWSGGGGHAIMGAGLTVGTGDLPSLSDEFEPRPNHPLYEDYCRFCEEWEQLPRAGVAVQVPIANSWDYTYGDQGFGVLPERQVAYGLRQYGGWALREVVACPDDAMPPAAA